MCVLLGILKKHGRSLLCTTTVVHDIPTMHFLCDRVFKHSRDTTKQLICAPQLSIITFSAMFSPIQMKNITRITPVTDDLCKT